jgi:two-component system sensor histidine kinase/response regulator
VILMDVQMPVMDGITATRRIRALSGAAARVPIIAMTANAMAEERQRCLEAGMDDHIGKPVNVRQLHAVLLRWTDAQASADTTPAIEQSEADFDFEGAISHMADSRPLWTRLAGRYLKTAPAAAEITAALAAGERETAQRGAHTLRGVAGALGLLGLQRAAMTLEQLLSEAGRDVGDAVAALARLDETARRVLAQHLG